MAAIGRQENATGVTDSEAFLILHRMTGLAARCALADGLSHEDVAQTLDDLAYAIRTGNVAEDMSPIPFPMN
jgi:hypothetical protein